ncbi:MAG: sugar phosphate isomerase/epimerase family protein [Armatimonadota bacterium]
MQLSLYTLLAKNEPLADSIELAANAGFDAVDVRQHEDGNHLPEDAPPERGEEVKQMVADAGLHISGLTTYYRCGITDPAQAEQNMAGIRRSMELARAMEAPYFRISGPKWDAETGYAKQREITREQLGEISELAAEHDIVVTVEQHGGALTASAGQILDLFRGVANENLGVVYDPGNCLKEGYERPLVQVDMLGELIRAVHVKNGMTRSADPVQELLPVDQVRLDQGILDWPAIFEALKAIDYSGYITLEDFFEFSSLAEKFAWNVEYIRPLIS